MEQMQLFTKGFNDGFILAKYEKEAAKQLSTIPQRTPYTMGLVSGISEVVKEIRFMQEFAKLRGKDVSKDIDR